MMGLRGRGRTLGLTAVAVVLLVVVLTSSLVSAKGRPKTRINEADIYFGDPGDFKKPAVVDVDAVYAKIPEYRRIVEKNMHRDNPLYQILLTRASERFRKALSKCARLRGYDLIGGLGSIELEKKTVPNITSLVMRALPR